MERNLKVTLKRDDKQVVLVMRGDDFVSSVRNGKVRWGSGRQWTVVEVLAIVEGR